ncbi:MAG: SUF system NifU family Fe-S cluster assembly protein [Ignavibacteriae bacterium]|nr:SUF system NifU family Fe-S cluster assembly protein [Ignavibacteria bacterium]MBI3363295.1 SUF system NifU family Fe-S cluster assembly protein [Ignavibacteriota bacterium]
MSALRELYQEVILDHNKSPRNFRKMEDATRTVEGYNPLCGDRYTVYVKFEDDMVKDVSFEGAGCAISKASASVMSAAVKGKTKAEAEALFAVFHKLVTGEPDPTQELDTLGKLAAFSGVSEFPARVKCAILAWHTLYAAMESNEEKVSTE